MNRNKDIYLEELFEEEQPDFPADEAAPLTYDTPEYLHQSCTLSDNENKERIASYSSEKKEVSAKKSS